MAFKNKRTRNLLILFVVLIAACAAYFIIDKAGAASQAKKESEAARESEENRIWLTQIDDLTSIQINNDKGTLTFHKKDDTWYEKADEKFPVNQTALGTLADTLSYMEATRKLEGADAPADYGLLEDALSVTVTDAKGVSSTIYIGNAVGDEYYAKISGSDTIYTVSSSLYSQITGKALYDFVQLESLPNVTSDEITSVKITANDKTYLYTKIPSEESGETAETDTAEPKESEAAKTKWQLKVDGKEEDIEDETSVTGLISAITGLSISGCINYNASESELEEYYLKDPEMTIQYTYETEEGEKTAAIYIGSMTSDSQSYYILLNQSSAINMMSAESVQGIKGYLPK